MEIKHRRLLSSATVMGMAGAMAGPAMAQTMSLDITIPRLSVAEYHRPYVAIWLEQEGAPARTLQVWYDYDMKNGEGTKWLRDVRQWWRASGRSMKLPADGVTGATRAPGKHQLKFTAGNGPLGSIAPGQYTLVIEAAREVGGRELLRLPFNWPAKAGATVRASGQSELGAVALSFGK
jgi:hypothetical protein